MATLTPTPEPQSADFSKFDYEVLWDLSGTSPVVKLTNKSTGSNLAGCKVWFELSSGGGGTIFHQGTELTPDATGVWTVINVAEAIPQVLGHIEWSGGNFVAKGWIKDSLDHVFTIPDKAVRICRPNGNKSETKNNYGGGAMNIETKCEMAKLFIEDKSNYGYNGQAGILFSKTIKLIYPPDGTGAIPSPRVVNNANAVLVPIWYSTEGYRAILETVYTYDFGNGISVRIKYKHADVFPVLCNLDLCPIIAYVQKMEESYEKNGCTSAERETMNLIQYKLTRVMMAKMQPLCGVDVNKIVDDIKKLANISCEHNENEANGIVSIYQAGEGLDCAGVKECLNASLNEVEPGCLATDLEWTGMNYDAKMATLIAQTCANSIQDINDQLPYKEIIGVVSQTGTAIPSLREVNNNLSDDPIVWTRTSAGQYVGTLTGKFTVNKTIVVTMNQELPIADRAVFIYSPDVNTVQILVRKISDGTFADFGQVDSLSFEVRVYA